ncbi:hypothetical protein ACB092_11G051300 [Castanea dentata]
MHINYQDHNFSFLSCYLASKYVSQGHNFSFSLSLRHPSSLFCFTDQLANSDAYKIHITESDTQPPEKHQIGPPTMAIHQTHITKHHKTQTHRNRVERKIEATSVQIPYNHHKTQTHITNHNLQTCAGTTHKILESFDNFSPAPARKVSGW